MGGCTWAAVHALHFSFNRLTWITVTLLELVPTRPWEP